MYQSIGEVVQDADLLSRLSADPDATMSTALTALSAKISFMLYIVRVYEQDVAVLVRFVMEGLPPLRMLFTQAGQLLTLLAKQQGESERRSIYFNICHACMQNWKYSVAAAETIRKLNAHIQSFNEKLPPFAITGVKHSKPFARDASAPSHHLDPESTISGITPDSRCSAPVSTLRCYRL